MAKSLWVRPSSRMASVGTDQTFGTELSFCTVGSITS